MICNNSVTIYHMSGLDVINHFEIWTRYNYDNVWVFESKNANTNKGYDNANNIEIRLPYDSNELNINNFAMGDIIVVGKLTNDITTQDDLKNYQTYVITNINNNNFGINQHIHIGGK